MKVILGLSGGVDSSVALKLLKDQGYDVEAMFMRNWDSATNNDILGNPDINEDVCPQEKDYKDAQKVAEQIGVKLNRIDFIEEYWDTVFTYFLNEYKSGRTPNPDIMCNKYIKFNAFLHHASTLGADYIAMGHYARVRHDKDKSYLLRGVDSNKDQTYFLCQISQEQLRHSLFPVGHLTKKEVREIAKNANLWTAEKKDSTGICFIGERNFHQFLKNYLPSQPGDMVTLDGKVVGRHDGLMYYTIGQRKGLGISNRVPLFVLGFNPLKNEVIVGEEYELYKKEILVTDINLLLVDEIPELLDVTVKTRYSSKEAKAKIIQDGKNIKVIFDEPQKAITPGQSAVFYIDDIVLGGGKIVK